MADGLKFYHVGESDGTFTPADSGWIDGYCFGDRLLEGVMFRICVGADGRLAAEVGPASAAYFDGLNGKRWLNEAVAYAARLDMFASSETANDDAVVLYDHSKPHTEQAARYETEPVFLDAGGTPSP
jgi:hypothetical protein